MALPFFHKQSGVMLAPSGSTVAPSGVVHHPLQVVGRIPILGSGWRFTGAGTPVHHVLSNLAKIADENGSSGGH